MKMTIALLIAGVAFTAGACGGDAKSEKQQAKMDQHEMPGGEHVPAGATSMGAHDRMPMELQAHETQGAMVTNKVHAMVNLPTVQCGICRRTIETGLVKTAGILSVQVDFESKMGHINYDGDKLSRLDVEKAIAALGYQANETLADAQAYAKLLDCCKVPE